MISLTQLKKTRNSVAAFSILIAIQSLYAQSADAQITFSSTVVSTTCALSFNAGVGASSATVTMANISTQTVNARSGAVGSALAPPTRFTVGFTSGKNPYLSLVE
jgi:type 1 fimbria pilin